MQILKTAGCSHTDSKHFKCIFLSAKTKPTLLLRIDSIYLLHESSSKAKLTLGKKPRSSGESCYVKSNYYKSRYGRPQNTSL